MADIKTEFDKLLSEAVHRRLEEIIDEETVTAAARVTKRIKEQMPQILCSVQKRFSVELMGDQMRITVILEDRGNRSTPTERP